MRRRCARWLILAAGIAAPCTAEAADFQIHYLDAAGEGFFDTTAISPPPGTSATTLGEARRAAFAYAVSIWSARLGSAAPIHVDARMDALSCTANSADLGAAGATTFHYDFPGAPLANTWYVQALGNALASAAAGRAVDLDPATSDIDATFNVAVDDPTCLGSTSWYYGLDARPSARSIDFVSIVLHELAHGLGFLSSVDPSTGSAFGGRLDVFARSLEQHNATPAALLSMTDAQRHTALTSEPNLHWTGALADAAGALNLTAGFAQGHVRMYGPAAVELGSTGSHFSSALAPDDLMEPVYTKANHDPALADAVLRDLGWRAQVSASVPLGGPRFDGALGLLLILVGGLSRRARGGRRS